MRSARKALLAATIVATAMGAGSAHAATLGTQSDSVGFNETELDATLSIGPFGGSGTVSSIDITFNGQIASTITLENVSGNEQQNFSASTGSAFTFSATEFSTGTAPQIELTADTGTADLEPGESQSFDVNDSGTSSVNVNSGLGDLLNGFDVDVTTSTSLTTEGGGGNLLSTQDTEAFASIDVTYNGERGSTDVPVPATFLLLGLGLCGLGVFGRRYANI